MKELYFMRHSEALKFININNNDSLQLQNEKWPLSEKGEELAKKISLMDEMKNFDKVYSSSYVRAISTAKYFTYNGIYIDENFGERKFGINNWEEKPIEFEKNQFLDFNYKVGNGESLNDVIDREYNSLLEILNTLNNQKVLIVGHSTAFVALLSKWCNISFENGYSFNGNIFFDGKWKHCEVFKLKFDENNNLIDIYNIKFN